MKTLSPEKKHVFLRASLCDKCNFKCQYCATDLGMENHTPICMKAPLLSAGQYVANLRLLAEHGFHIISFTGGEPLLNPDFPYIAKECRKLFDTIEITTNATMLREYIEVVKKYIDVLKISVDAVDKNLAVAISGNPKAADTLSVIEDCCKAGIKTIGLNFVYMKQNKAELPKLVQVAKRMKQQYGTEIYISVLDLYYSRGNHDFWKEQFINLVQLREELTKEGRQISRRERIGCDSYYFIWDGIRVNMKDSLSRTHRAEMCETCEEYCQEGIYSLKHSASGWLSACPSNNPQLGKLLSGYTDDEQAHDIIDYFVELLNQIKQADDTGQHFLEARGL